MQTKTYSEETLAVFRAVRRGNFVIVDTETSGLKRPAEICQLAVIDHFGSCLMNELIDPRGEIPNEASRVHGITKLHTKGCPTWPEIRGLFLETIAGKDVITYNATFDRHMCHCSDDAWELPECAYGGHGSWLCAMKAYAELWGELNAYYGDFKWQKLSLAIEQQGLQLGMAHDALGDATMTYYLLGKCAQVYLSGVDLS